MIDLLPGSIAAQPTEKGGVYPECSRRGSHTIGACNTRPCGAIVKHDPVYRRFSHSSKSMLCRLGLPGA